MSASAARSPSSLRIALMTRRPPGARFGRASTTGRQAGVVSMIASSGTGARSRRVAGPYGAQRARELALGFAAGEHVDLGVGVALADELQDEMRGPAEARETETAAVAEIRQAQRSVADRAGAQQGSRLGVREPIRQGVGEVLAHDHDTRRSRRPRPGPSRGTRGRDSRGPSCRSRSARTPRRSTPRRRACRVAGRSAAGRSRRRRRRPGGPGRRAAAEAACALRSRRSPCGRRRRPRRARAVRRGPATGSGRSASSSGARRPSSGPSVRRSWAFTGRRSGGAIVPWAHADPAIRGRAGLRAERRTARRSGRAPASPTSRTCSRSRPSSCSTAATRTRPSPGCCTTRPRTPAGGRASMTSAAGSAIGWRTSSTGARTPTITPSRRGARARRRTSPGSRPCRTSARLVSAADKYANARALLDDYRTQGDSALEPLQRRRRHPLVLPRCGRRLPGRRAHAPRRAPPPRRDGTLPPLGPRWLWSLTRTLPFACPAGTARARDGLPTGTIRNYGIVIRFGRSPVTSAVTGPS